MPKKKVDYGNGLRGCFLTLIKWPLQIIVTGLLSYVLYLLIHKVFPKGDQQYEVIGAVVSAAYLIRLCLNVIDTFFRFATAEKQPGIVALHRDLGGDE